jgi:3-oxoisoapionate decarboxylase
MRTRLGLGSYACAWSIGVSGYEQPDQPMDALALIKFAAELGLRLVQIGDNLPLDMMSFEDRMVLRETANQLGITVEVGTRGIVVTHLQDYIQIAHFFGSPILRVVVDTAAHHPSPEEVVTLIRHVLPALDAANVTLAIENHDRFKASTFAWIIEQLNHPNVGICLDTVNSFGSLEGPDVVVESLEQHVVNLHIKEFVVRRLSHNMGFEITGVPAGQGMLDIPWLLEKLNRHGRPYNAIIELWPALDETMQETIDKEVDWVRQSVTYLRTLIKD